MKVKLTNPNARAPKRTNPDDAGADIFSTEQFILFIGSTKKLNVGFQMQIDTGTAGFIYARSGLGTNDGIIPKNCVGVIDSKYRGDVIVALTNTGTKPYQVNIGDRIAQIVIAPVILDPIEVVDELDMENDRCGGLGHSGK
jgi:dUTP pyrophosphatase